MYCKNCGKELNDNAISCPVCGVSTETAQFQQPVINVINNNKNTNINTGGKHYAHKSKWTAFFLCLFLGYLGVHRFYVGKHGTGLVWLFTGGMFSIGWIVDLVMIFAGSFRDKNGYKVI